MGRQSEEDVLFKPQGREDLACSYPPVEQEDDGLINAPPPQKSLYISMTYPSCKGW